MKLQREEEKMLKKIENERKKAEELIQIRQSYDVKMYQIRQASYEREMKQEQAMETNQNMKKKSIQNKYEKVREIGMYKKYAHDEVKDMKVRLESEKERFKTEYQNQKLLNAYMIRSQLQEAKQRLKMMKNVKDQQTKVSYIQRVQKEQHKKSQIDMKIKELEGHESALMDKLRTTKDMYMTVKHNQSSFIGKVNDKTQSQINHVEDSRDHTVAQSFIDNL